MILSYQCGTIFFCTSVLWSELTPIGINLSQKVLGIIIIGKFWTYFGAETYFLWALYVTSWCRVFQSLSQSVLIFVFLALYFFFFISPHSDLHWPIVDGNKRGERGAKNEKATWVDAERHFSDAYAWIHGALTYHMQTNYQNSGVMLFINFKLIQFNRNANWGKHYINQIGKGFAFIINAYKC